MVHAPEEPTLMPHSHPLLALICNSLVGVGVPFCSCPPPHILLRKGMCLSSSYGYLPTTPVKTHRTLKILSSGVRWRASWNDHKIKYILFPVPPLQWIPISQRTFLCHPRCDACRLTKPNTSWILLPAIPVSRKVEAANSSKNTDG